MWQLLFCSGNSKLVSSSTYNNGDLSTYFLSRWHSTLFCAQNEQQQKSSSGLFYLLFAEGTKTVLTNHSANSCCSQKKRKIPLQTFFQAITKPLTEQTIFTYYITSKSMDGANETDKS